SGGGSAAGAGTGPASSSSRRSSASVGTGVGGASGSGAGPGAAAGGGAPPPRLPRARTGVVGQPPRVGVGRLHAARVPAGRGARSERSADSDSLEALVRAFAAVFTDPVLAVLLACERAYRGAPVMDALADLPVGGTASGPEPTHAADLAERAVRIVEEHRDAV